MCVHVTEVYNKTCGQDVVTKLNSLWELQLIHQPTARHSPQDKSKLPGLLSPNLILVFFCLCVMSAYLENRVISQTPAMKARRQETAVSFDTVSVIKGT
jgi:hypothetical protein